MNVKEIMKCGLIGLNAEVVDSKNKKMIGIKGKIVGVIVGKVISGTIMGKMVGKHCYNIIIH